MKRPCARFTLTRKNITSGRMAIKCSVKHYLMVRGRSTAKQKKRTLPTRKDPVIVEEGEVNIGPVLLST